MDTIPAVLSQVGRRSAGSGALVHCQRKVRWTYAQLLDRAGRAAAGLRSLGLGPGQPAAIWGSNRPEWLVSQIALSLLGAVWVPLNPGAGPEEAAFLLRDSGARVLLLGPELEPVWERARPGLEDLTVIVWPANGAGPAGGGMAWAELLALGSTGLDPEPAARVSAGDPAAIMYTSGTTGRPKGVILSQGGLVTRCLASTERQGLSGRDRLALFFPLFHMFGNTCVALAGLCRGASLIMPADAFEPEAVLAALAGEGCTAVYGTPSMFAALLDDPDLAGRDLSSLRTGIVGGAPCPPELMKRIVAELGAGQITVGYGITEASSWVTLTRPDDPLELRVSTAGPPLPGCEVRIFDPETDRPLPPGRTGEIAVRGGLMLGYHRLEGLTGRAIDRRGWYRTGDLGLLDEAGYLRLNGRLKDVIRRDGAEIHPAEVEEVLYRLEGVAEAQAFGLPDERRGQLLALWVRPKAGSELSLEAVAAFLRVELKEGLQPDRIKLTESFPTTPSGKVQKYRLRELAQAEEGRAGSG